MLDGGCLARFSKRASVSSADSPFGLIGVTLTLRSPITRSSSRIAGRGVAPGSRRMLTVASAAPGSTLLRKAAVDDGRDVDRPQQAVEQLAVVPAREPARRAAALLGGARGEQLADVARAAAAEAARPRAQVAALRLRELGRRRLVALDAVERAGESGERGVGQRPRGVGRRA